MILICEHVHPKPPCERDTGQQRVCRGIFDLDNHLFGMVSFDTTKDATLKTAQGESAFDYVEIIVEYV